MSGQIHTKDQNGRYTHVHNPCTLSYNCLINKRKWFMAKREKGLNKAYLKQLSLTGSGCLTQTKKKTELTLCRQLHAQCIDSFVLMTGS